MANNSTNWVSYGSDWHNPALQAEQVRRQQELDRIANEFRARQETEIRRRELQEAQERRQQQERDRSGR